MVTRNCQKCGLPLPEGSHGTRKFCDLCRKVNDREAVKAWAEKHPRPKKPRVCRRCHLPLPVDCSNARKYCDSCREIADKEQDAKYRAAHPKKIRLPKPNPEKKPKVCGRCGVQIPSGTRRKWCANCVKKIKNERQNADRQKKQIEKPQKTQKTRIETPKLYKSREEKELEAESKFYDDQMRKLDAGEKQCPVCGKWFSIADKDSTNSSMSFVFCSTKCRNSYRLSHNLPPEVEEKAEKTEKYEGYALIIADEEPKKRRVMPPKKVVKFERACMKCGVLFWSEGENVCPECSHKI